MLVGFYLNSDKVLAFDSALHYLCVMDTHGVTFDWLVARTVQNGECMEWQGNKDKDGYGEVRRRGVRKKAHRLSFLLYYGALTPGLQVMHSCDNPSCINPKHLSEGTCADNMRDKAKKGRCAQQLITHCPQGHEYVARDTRVSKSGVRAGRIHRLCHLCQRESSKKRSRAIPRKGRPKQSQFMTAQEMKDKRIAAGWTRPELAAKMGLGEINASQRIYSMETGKRGITQATAKLLEIIFSNQ